MCWKKILQIAAVGGLLLCEALPGDELKGKWLEVKTEHFTVITNGGERSGKKIAENFEQIREVFLSALPALQTQSVRPIEVIAVRGERSMKVLLPQYAEDRKANLPAGTFQRTLLGPKILVREEAVGGEDFSVVFHEYFHFLVHGANLVLPVWLDEGLASFWGEARLTREYAELGRPDYPRLALLQTQIHMPLEDLLKVDRSSPEYRERHRVSLFYAQSWALTHYLILGDQSGTRRKQFTRYLQMVLAGKPGFESAEEAFGDLETLSRELQKYSRTLRFKMLQYPAPPPMPREAFQVRTMSTGEASAVAAMRLLITGRTSAAQKLVVRARAEAPRLPISLEASGMYAARTGDVERAAEDFERAVEAGIESPISHYGLAVTTLHQATDRESLQKSEKLLARAIALGPRFAPAYARLAEVYRRGDPDLRRALEMIFQARALGPVGQYSLEEAHLLFEDGQHEKALSIAGDAATHTLAGENAGDANRVCWRGSLWGLAEAVLPACDKALELDPTRGTYLDSRGLARALTGDLQGAVADFRAALAAQRDEWSSILIERRERWLAALENGENPIPEELDELKIAPEEIGLLWWS